MLRGGEGSVETASQERFKALFRAVEGGSAGPPDRSPGVTEDGRYAYRYDDDGRFYAAPIRRAKAELAMDDFPA